MVEKRRQYKMCLWEYCPNNNVKVKKEDIKVDILFFTRPGRSNKKLVLSS